MPAGASVVAGDALDAATYAARVPAGATFVHLVGVVRPRTPLALPPRAVLRARLRLPRDPRRRPAARPRHARADDARARRRRREPTRRRPHRGRARHPRGLTRRPPTSAPSRTRRRPSRVSTSFSSSRARTSSRRRCRWARAWSPRSASRRSDSPRRGRDGSRGGAGRRARAARPPAGVPSVVACRAALGFRGAALASLILYVTNFAWIAVNNVIAASVLRAHLRPDPPRSVSRSFSASSRRRSSRAVRAPSATRTASPCPCFSSSEPPHASVRAPGRRAGVLSRGGRPR